MRPVVTNLLRRVGGGVDVFRSAEVGDVNASTLVITMSGRLNASIVPATTAFAVDDGVANAVTNVAISGRAVTLTLTNAVEVGDVITVAYTKSGVNPLQDSQENEVESWTAQSVTNSVGVYMLDGAGNPVLDGTGGYVIMPY